MPSQMDFLAGRLAAAQIGQKKPSHTPLPGNVHMLSFKYPDADLLPNDGNIADVLPYLFPPADIELRMPPDEVACHGHTIGTSFFARVPVRPANPFQAPRQSDAKGLHDAIDELQTTSGHSWLHMVTYSHADDLGNNLILHRAVIKTSHDIAINSLGEHFSFSHIEYEHMARETNRKGWVLVLDDLIHRSSDRAFFEVRKHYFATNSTAAMKESGQWDDVWATRLPRTITEMFYDQLQPVMEADSERFHAAGDALLHLRFPCGHELAVRKIMLDTLTEEAMLVEPCPKCKLLIMDPTNEAEIQVYQALKRSEEYKSTDKSWESLDNNVPQGPTRITFSHDTLLDMIHRARNSLDVPSSIIPAALNPSEYSEVAAVEAHFYAHFGRENKTVTMTPSDLYHLLFCEASEARRAGVDEGGLLVSQTGVPVDWTSVKSIWLDRSVGLLVELLALDGSFHDVDSDDDDDDTSSNRMGGGNEYNHEEEMANMQQRMQDVEMT